MKRSLVIIPTYNEIENIAAITKAILEAAPAQTEILVVDDNSPDGTGKCVDELSKADPRIHALHRPGKQGLGPAYIQGFRWGIAKDYDHLIQMDADFSHDPKYLPKLLQNIENYDFVIGSRNVPGGGTVNWSWLRRLISKCGSFYARTWLGAPYRDFTGGFICWRKSVLQSFELDHLGAGGYSFLIELKFMAFRKGYKFLEIPIIFEDRRVGNSKMSFKIILEALALVPKLRFKWHT